MFSNGSLQTRMSITQELFARIDELSTRLEQLETNIAPKRSLLFSQQTLNTMLQSYIKEANEIEQIYQQLKKSIAELSGSQEIDLQINLQKKLEEIEQRLKIAKERVNAQARSNKHSAEIAEAKRAASVDKSDSRFFKAACVTLTITAGLVSAAAGAAILYSLK